MTQPQPGLREPTVKAQVTDAFSEFLDPLVREAREQLDAQVKGESCLPEVAMTRFERHLHQRLLKVCGPTLMFEFDVWRSARETGLDRLLPSWRGARRTSIYEEFVEQLSAGSTRALLREYEALGDLVDTVRRHWVAFVAEFEQRLQQDLPGLGRLTVGGASPTSVRDIRVGISDAHEGGRSVVTLALDDGVSIAYKPRPTGVEARFNDLLGTLNDLGSGTRLRILRVWERPGYGWVEFAKRRECASSAEVALYYRRSGMLLALAYVLDGIDFHHENIVASGPDPVLVDTETLFHPNAWVRAESGSARGVAMAELEDSVLRTLLLPSWIVGPGGACFDISGLGGVVPQPTSHSTPRWVDAGTDDMRREPAESWLREHANAPRLEGERVCPHDHVDSVVAGFEEAHTLIERHRRHLLSPGGPLTALSRCQVRVLFRETRDYAGVLRGSLRPERLRSRSSRRAYFRQQLEPQSRIWPPAHREAVLRCELESLESADIPMFRTRADSGRIVISGSRQAEPFGPPAASSVARRIAGLDVADRERQVGLIRASFAAAGRVLHGEGRDPISESPPPPVPTSARSLAPEAMVEAACSIGRLIERQAHWGSDGTCTWTSQELLRRSGRYRLSPLGVSLFSGLAGVALFASALWSVTGDARDRALAEGALGSLRYALDRHGAQLLPMCGLGGASGLASVVYALVRAGGLLGEESWIDQARRTARLITIEAIAEDDALDVVHGSAGTILGLRALDAVTPEAWISDRMIAAGERLVERQQSCEGGGAAWHTVGAACAGFSHGAAGIAYALLVLEARTGDARYAAAAREGIAYEGTLFDPESGHWADLRPGASGSARSAPMTAWCNGAPGIGLARLAGHRSHPDREALADALRALDATLRYGVSGHDHPCCGSLGRVELLREAGRALGRDDLTRLASDWTSEVVRQGAVRGHYLIGARREPWTENVGFFQGLAGVGYHILRAAEPERIPSVLLWD